jgi:N-acetylglucosaminyldiphosphoundecaprenol N-acetyl-beta-D-mannosaminyltransferase
MSIERKPDRVRILKIDVTAAPFNEQLDLIMAWGKDRLSRYVCVSNVHMLMEAYWNEPFAEVLHRADLVTPDGMPLVWMLNLLRHRSHDRVAGMDLMLGVCQYAARTGMAVYFLGSDAETLGKMRCRLNQELPHLNIAGMDPLPFRPLTPEEDRLLIQTVNESQAGAVFVALGCPKQEVWMRDHRDKIQAVMVGVGGVFAVYAGDKKQAPPWVQQSGLEWFYRLMQEPFRLWMRYSTTIPPFVLLALKQILKTRFFKPKIKKLIEH